MRGERLTKKDPEEEPEPTGPEDGGRMVRASVPEADAQIGVRRQVLDHGFVVLVDYMGNDNAIVQAARVSYGLGTKGARDDRGLIRYLMRHRHTTPFEMVEFKFLVRLPIFVARQMIRHRTACLAEGTRIYFDLPGGLRRRRGNALYTLPIEKLWARFQPTRNRRGPRQRNPYYRRDRVQGMHLRALDETDWTLGHTRVVGVTRSGEKPVFRMRLRDGKSIECTADHRFLFQGGWATLHEQTGLREVAGQAVWERGTYVVHVNGETVEYPALYTDKDWLERVFVRERRTVSDIAEACGVDPRTILHWARKWGLRREPLAQLFSSGNRFGGTHRSRRGLHLLRRVQGDGSEPYRDRDWMRVRWVDGGRSTGSIASEIGVSPATVRKWLRLHGLTNHPGHPSRRPFARGMLPWNRGLRYRLGPQRWSAQKLAAVRRARAGPASNFWKGGMSSERESIGRWTTQIAKAVHARNGWTCQLCHRRAPVLHAHHVVPVWADLSRARDEANLTSLCDACHRIVHRNEAAYVERLGGAPAVTPWVRRPRTAWNRLRVPRLVEVLGFEYVGRRMTYDIEVEGPSHNFVANGIITHNSVNEYSARYSIMPDEFYLPQASDVRAQSERNRQGRDALLPSVVAGDFLAGVSATSREAYRIYKSALEQGVARELARVVLPVNYYTQWYWKIDLHNLLHFLSLRLDPHAQEEIRRYAEAMAISVKAVVPVAYEAFEDFTLSAEPLTRREKVALRGLLEGLPVPEALDRAGLRTQKPDGSPLKSGEGVEFLEKLERIRAAAL